MEFDRFLSSLEMSFNLIYTMDSELVGIVLLSLKCTFFACLLACVLGIPIAYTLANTRFFGRRAIVLLFNTLQALPTTVVGLLLYIFIARRGLLGDFGLLYTWKAITLGQAVLIFPVLTMFIVAALSRLDSRYRETALTLGASRFQVAYMVFREARFAVVAAVCAAFGRGISEVGVSMMLGGNIREQTRTMPTAMAMEYDKGEFELALALGIVLLLVSFIMNASLAFFQGRMEN